MEENRNRRKNIPKKEIEPIVNIGDDLTSKEKIKNSIKNEPEVKKQIEEMRQSGMYEEKDIERILEKAADTFLNKLLAAIQGEQEKEKQPEKELEKEPEKEGGLFG